jgi:hypothetical protein
LLVTWSHWVPYTCEQLAALERYWRRARRRVLLYDASFGSVAQRFRQQVRELAMYPWLWNADEVCYMSVWPQADLFGGMKKRYSYCSGPNVDVLFDPQLEGLLHAPYEPDRPRRFFMLVAGSRGTQHRAAIVDRLRTDLGEDMLFAGPDDESEQPVGAGRRVVYWRVGGHGVPHRQFIGIMSDSDFVLCLPGQFWTTRPYEAVARGAVPILGDDFLHSYDIDWKDGANCIVIKGGNDPDRWVGAVRRASAIPAEQLVSMRRNIWEIGEQRLRPGRARMRLLSRLGLC